MHALRIVTVLIALVGGLLTFAQDTKTETAKLAKLKATYAASKAKFTKSPKDAGLRKAYVTATVNYANSTMYSPILGAKVKYRQALQLYREALKADPKNKEALENKNLIESIYKQMGRPIPPQP